MFGWWSNDGHKQQRVRLQKCYFDAISSISPRRRHAGDKKKGKTGMRRRARACRSVFPFAFTLQRNCAWTRNFVLEEVNGERRGGAFRSSQTVRRKEVCIASGAIHPDSGRNLEIGFPRRWRLDSTSERSLNVSWTSRFGRGSLFAAQFHFFVPTILLEIIPFSSTSRYIHIYIHMYDYICTRVTRYGNALLLRRAS